MSRSMLHADFDMMLQNGWGIEISPFQNSTEEVELTANRGHWWIRFGYPVMSGKLERFAKTTGQVNGICWITDRSMLHRILLSADNEIEERYVVPPPIKPGTERQPVPPKEESAEEESAEKPVTEKPITGAAETP